MLLPNNKTYGDEEEKKKVRKLLMFMFHVPCFMGRVHLVVLNMLSYAMSFVVRIRVLQQTNNEQRSLKETTIYSMQVD